MKGRTLHDILHITKMGKTIHDIVHEGLMCRTAHLLCYSKFMHSCRVSDQWEVKREIQVMLPLVLLIKFVLLLIIFPASFSFNLLVANWWLSPEFWSPKMFSTRHGDQNGHSLERWAHELCRPVAQDNWIFLLHVSRKLFIPSCLKGLGKFSGN